MCPTVKSYFENGNMQGESEEPNTILWMACQRQKLRVQMGNRIVDTLTRACQRGKWGELESLFGMYRRSGGKITSSWIDLELSKPRRGKTVMLLELYH